MFKNNNRFFSLQVIRKPIKQQASLEFECLSPSFSFNTWNDEGASISSHVLSMLEYFKIAMEFRWRYLLYGFMDIYHDLFVDDIHNLFPFSS